MGFHPGPEPGLDADASHAMPLASLGLRGLVGGPLANLWPYFPPRGLLTPHRPAQRGLWEAPKDRRQYGDTGAGTEVPA